MLIALELIAARPPPQLSTHPLSTLPGASPVQRIRQRREQVEQLEGAIDIDSAEVATRLFPYYLTLNRGKLDPQDSLLVATPGGPGMVLFPARYPKIKDAEAVLPGLRALIGAETDNLFKTRLSITVDCEAIPQEKQQEVGDALVELFERYGCVSALSQEEITKPAPEFHALRHRLLTPEANAALQAAFPISASVKTKGVKG